MLRVLFLDDDGGWLEDPTLLDRLVTGKLQAEAETIAVESWSGVPAPMMKARLMPSCSPSIGRWKTNTWVRMNCLTRSTRGLACWKRRWKRSRPGHCSSIRQKSDGQGAFVTLDRYGTLTVYRGYDHLTSDESIENGNTAYEYTFTETLWRFG